MTPPTAAWTTPGTPGTPAYDGVASDPGGGLATSRAPLGRVAERRRGPVPLRPLSVGELLDGGVALVRTHPRPVLAMSAALAVVSAVLQLAVALTLLGPLTRTDTTSLRSGTAAFQSLLGSAAVATGLTLLVSAVCGAVLAGVVTAVASRSVLGLDITLREAWALARPRLAPLVATALLVALTSYGTFFGSVVLAALLAERAGVAGAVLAVPLAGAGAVAAAYLYVRWSLATAVVVLEREPIRPALARSAVLVRRSWLRVFSVLLLAVAIAAFVGQVLQLPFQLLGGNPFAGLGGGQVRLTTGKAVVAAVAGALSTTVVAPFTAGVRALLYVDRRMRAEGLDIVLAAQAAG